MAITLRIIGFVVLIYVFICGFLYSIQENLIFFPKKLNSNYLFEFDQEFEEIYVETEDNEKLHGLLFKADSAKGLVFYLHGNAGALDSWGDIAHVYTDLNYDIFILDYRGYGKSRGKIKSQDQFFKDVQLAYNKLKTIYQEDNITVIGYSIGTASAAMLASKNNPKRLILKAPYYSITDMMHQAYPFVPGLVLKYKFETFDFLEKTKTPVTIFHGEDDEVIYYGSSLKLEKHFKPKDKLITLENQGHNMMNYNPKYQFELSKILLE